MSNSAKSKRLDKIELQLTPRQWAIRMADEMRRYPSREDFLKALGKDTCRQAPFIAPFFPLGEQAKERWPTDNRKEVELSGKLRTAFRLLTLLLANINNAIMRKAEENRLKVALQESMLQTLIWKGAFVHVAITDVSWASSAIEARLCPPSLLENWVDNLTLLMNTIAYKAAVQAIQEKYFESHPILFKDVETEFETTIGMVRHLIAGFNEYRKDVAGPPNRESDQEQQKAGIANALPFESEISPPIDIEAIEKCSEELAHFIVERWVRDATVIGTADILRETGMHEDYVWQHFRKEMGLES